MRDMAKITIVGRAGGVPTIRNPKKDQKPNAIYFKVAVSGKSKKNPDGSWNNDVPASWYTVNVIGEKAVEGIEKMGIQKGEQLYIEGSLEIKTFEKEDGTKITYPDVTTFSASDVQVVHRPKTTETPSSNPPYASKERQEKKKAQDEEMDWGAFAPGDEPV